MGSNEGKSRRLTVDTPTAAEMIGVSPRTLANWRLQGHGPPFLKLGTGEATAAVRYRVAALEEWLAGRERRSTSDRRRA